LKRIDASRETGRRGSLGGSCSLDCPSLEISPKEGKMKVLICTGLFGDGSKRKGIKEGEAGRREARPGM
jgi:hypothetical protein